MLVENLMLINTGLDTHSRFAVPSCWICGLVLAKCLVINLFEKYPNKITHNNKLFSLLKNT